MPAAACARAGADYLDCPILGGGGRVGAAAGRLRFPLGGDPATVEAARPVLDLLATDAVVVGPVGAGQVVKLAFNYQFAVSAVALAQAVQFALAGGADLAVAFAAQVGVPVSTGLSARDAFHAGIDAGLGGLDVAALVQIRSGGDGC